MTIPDRLLAERVIPVVRGLTAATAQPLAGALALGGLTTIEVTMESPDAIPAIAKLKDSDMIVGAGTVTSIAQAELAMDNGAIFLVSPHLDPALVAWAADKDALYIPGVFTPTEVATAISLGVETMKLFPASTCGPDHVGALLGPFPGLKLVATGGITADNAAVFLERGCVAVGVGGWLTGHKDLAVVVERTKALVAAV